MVSIGTAELVGVRRGSAGVWPGRRRTNRCGSMGFHLATKGQVVQFTAPENCTLMMISGVLGLCATSSGSNGGR